MMSSFRNFGGFLGILGLTFALSSVSPCWGYAAPLASQKVRSEKTASDFRWQRYRQLAKSGAWQVVTHLGPVGLAAAAIYWSSPVEQVSAPLSQRMTRWCQAKLQEFVSSPLGQMSLGAYAIHNVSQLGKMAAASVIAHWERKEDFAAKLILFEEFFSLNRARYSEATQLSITEKIARLREAIQNGRDGHAELIVKHLGDVFALPLQVEVLDVDRVIRNLGSVLNEQDDEIGSGFFDFGLTVARQSHRKDRDLSPQKHILLVYGPPGVGKTTLSHRVMRAIFDRDPALIELGNVNSQGGFFGVPGQDGLGTKGALARAALEGQFKGRNFPFIMDEVHLALNPPDGRRPSSLFNLNSDLRQLLEFNTQTIPERGLGIEFPVGAVVGILVSNELPRDEALLNRLPRIEFPPMAQDLRRLILDRTVQAAVEQEDRVLLGESPEILATGNLNLPSAQFMKLNSILHRARLRVRPKFDRNMPLLLEDDKKWRIASQPQARREVTDMILSLDRDPGVRVGIYVAREYCNHLANRAVLFKFLTCYRGRRTLKPQEMRFLYRQLERLSEPFDIVGAFKKMGVNVTLPQQ